MDALQFVRSYQGWHDWLHSSYLVVERRRYARKKKTKKRLIVVCPYYELEIPHATTQRNIEEPTKKLVVYEEKYFSKHISKHFSKIPLFMKSFHNETLWCSYCLIRTKIATKGMDEELFAVSDNKLIKFTDIPNYFAKLYCC